MESVILGYMLTSLFALGKKLLISSMRTIGSGSPVGLARVDKVPPYETITLLL